MFTSEIPIKEFNHHAHPDNGNIYGKYWYFIPFTYSLNISPSMMRLIY